MQVSYLLNPDTKSTVSASSLEAANFLNGKEYISGKEYHKKLETMGVPKALYYPFYGTNQLNFLGKITVIAAFMILMSWIAICATVFMFPDSMLPEQALVAAKCSIISIVASVCLGVIGIGCSESAEYIKYNSRHKKLNEASLSKKLIDLKQKIDQESQRLEKQIESNSEELKILKNL